MTAGDGTVLQEEMIKEFSGEDDVSKVDMLVLRGLGLAHVSAIKEAANLTSLSLSHNVLREIALPRAALALLVELNVNKNALTSFSFLESCPALERLYASNNQFADASPLAGYPSLSIVCIHGNLLEDLNLTVQSLGALPKLTQLELDGNPLSYGPGYKHTVVKRLPGLQTLDGEMLMSKDHEDAYHYDAYQNRRSGVQNSLHAPAKYSEDELKAKTATELRSICQTEGVDDAGLLWQMLNRLLVHFGYPPLPPPTYTRKAAAAAAVAAAESALTVSEGDVEAIAAREEDIGEDDDDEMGVQGLSFFTHSDIVLPLDRPRSAAAGTPRIY
jgi:hypothetical protein